MNFSIQPVAIVFVFGGGFVHPVITDAPLQVSVPMEMYMFGVMEFMGGLRMVMEFVPYCG